MKGVSPERLAAARASGAKSAKAKAGGTKSFELRPLKGRPPRAGRPPQGSPSAPKAPVRLGTRVVYTGTEYSARTGTEAVLVSYGVGESVATGQSRGHRSPPGSYVIQFGCGWRGLARPDEVAVAATPAATGPALR